MGLSTDLLPIQLSHKVISESNTKKLQKPKMQVIKLLFRKASLGTWRPHKSE